MATPVPVPVVAVATLVGRVVGRVVVTMAAVYTSRATGGVEACCTCPLAEERASISMMCAD